MRTAELNGAALDWAVAKCEGDREANDPDKHDDWDLLPYSTDWAQGGPIIEREWIALIPPNERIDEWEAVHPTQMHDEQYGETALIAAMRCYVASKLGNEVEIPEELK